MFRQRMAVSAILLALVSGVPSVIAQSPSDHGGAAAQLVGRWKLVSLEAVRPNGEVVREWGPKPVGHLIYDASGFVAVQIVRDPRAAVASQIRRKSQPGGPTRSCFSPITFSGTTRSSRTAANWRAACCLSGSNG